MDKLVFLVFFFFGKANSTVEACHCLCLLSSELSTLRVKHELKEASQRRRCFVIGHLYFKAPGANVVSQEIDSVAFSFLTFQRKMKVKVTWLSLALCNPMGYIVHGIHQARILEWAAFPFSRGSSQPRDRTQVSHIADR